MKIRVYAIPDCDDVHDISNDDFMDKAEGLGYVWSLLGFQNELNCEGTPSLKMSDFNSLHFRFINIEKEGKHTFMKQTLHECCCDLGNMFFQYINQDNKKVYECCECKEQYTIMKVDKNIEIERNTNTPSMDKIQDLLDMADKIKNRGK